MLWGLLGVGVVLLVSAAGAAADPATGRPGTESWALPHLALAAVGGLLIAQAFFAQWSAISKNHQLIRTITAEVRRIRRERGLDG